MIVPPPVLESILVALRTFAVTDEELDLQASLEHVNDVHRASNPGALDEPDGDWGLCECCMVTFPCRMWTESHGLGIEWLSRRAAEQCGSGKRLLAPLPAVVPAPRTSQPLKVIK